MIGEIKMDSIAGVVLFNPDIDELNAALNNLLRQFGRVILFDNTENASVLNYDFPDEVIYMTDGKNQGIAYALNRIMEKADELGYKWVYSFDQDSKVPDNILAEYSKFYSDSVGILCSQVIDKRRKYMKADNSGDEITEVKKSITSASCTNVDAWKLAEKYDEQLFIDLVDNDLSKRIRIVGYKILRVNSVILEQQLGVIEFKDTLFSRFVLKLSEITKIKNIAKLSYKKKVNPMRIYYTNRNVIYLNKKFKKYDGIGYESYYCKSYFSFFVLFNISSFFRGSRGSAKKEIFNAIVKGVKDGKKLAKNTLPYSFESSKNMKIGEINE